MSLPPDFGPDTAVITSRDEFKDILEKDFSIRIYNTDVHFKITDIVEIENELYAGVKFKVQYYPDTLKNKLAVEFPFFGKEPEPILDDYLEFPLRLFTSNLYSEFNPINLIKLEYLLNDDIQSKQKVADMCDKVNFFIFKLYSESQLKEQQRILDSSYHCHFKID